MLSTLHDVTGCEDAEEKLIEMAQFDVLTGLVNRGVFVANLDRALADARRRGGRVTVLYLDLDHFKDVNDTLGHPVGDGLLSRWRNGSASGHPTRSPVSAATSSPY